MPRAYSKFVLLVGLYLIGQFSPASTYLSTRLGDLEARRAHQLTPHQRFVAERIIKASRDYEGARPDGTFAMWVKAGLRADDTVFIESIADLLWDTKSVMHLPLTLAPNQPGVLGKPRHAGSVLILEQPTIEAAASRDPAEFDGVINSILEEGHFAVVVFVDDKNMLTRVNSVLREKLTVVDLSGEAERCETAIASR
jgi:hypothetical protein